MKQQKKMIALQHSRQKKAAQGVPLIVFFLAFGLGIMGYVVSRFIVTEHPLHWAAMVGGVFFGIVIGYIWYFIRGDVNII